MMDSSIYDCTYCEFTETFYFTKYRIEADTKYQLKYVTYWKPKSIS